MKYKNDVEFTIMGYLHSTCYANDVTDDIEILRILSGFKQLSAYSPYLLPVFFVVDYTKRKYLFFSESIKQLLGYDARQILEGGIPHTVDAIQKDYFDTYNKYAFPISLSFLREAKPQNHADYIFSFNYQMRNAKGRYIDILQKNSYISHPETGIPLFGLNIAFDITGFKKDRTLVQTIEKINPANGTRNLIASNLFFPFEEDNVLSKQEIKVLKFVVEGLNSKMIAKMLNISESTVISHRKNTMKKCNSKNVAELISFGFRNHIL